MLFALAGFAACYLLVVAGVLLISVPAGLIAAGLLGLALMYAVADLLARPCPPPRPAPRPDGP